MEKWKSIKGFEGIYEVSNLGRIKSLKRKTVNKGNFSGISTIKERILKQTINRLGYHVVTLFKDGKRHFSIVHRLVAKEFIENKNNYKEVNHKDLNKSNNNAENLEWCDRAHNINHFYSSKVTSSKYKGVSYQKDRNKWVAFINLNKKRITIGRFNTELEAHLQRLNYITKLKQTNYEELI